MYFDGTSMIAINGEVVAQAPQFSLLDSEVITACIDIHAIESFRLSIASRRSQATELQQDPLPIVQVDRFVATIEFATFHRRGK